MKTLLVLALCSSACFAQKSYGYHAPKTSTSSPSKSGGDVYVRPTVTKNGEYRQGHYQTAPNSTKTDNYSTKGNVNPYTGKAGTKNPY